jgi:hypothetical protein
MRIPSTAGRLGAREPCPFCGSTAGVVADPDGHHCLVCGGPRVLVDSEIARARSEQPLLIAARSSQRKRAGWSVSAAIAALLGVMAVGGAAVLALFTNYGSAGFAAFGTAALVSFGLAGLGFGRARREATAVRGAFEAAQVAVTEDLLRARGTLDVGSLSQMLHVPSEQAEQLLAQAQVETLLDDEPALRVRLDVGTAEDPASESQARSPEARRTERR